MRLRGARLDDRIELQNLIERSARGLGTQDYSPGQIELALGGTFGVDTPLIADGTYYVVEETGTIVGCGGWSRRRTLFGGDTGKERNEARLDPRVDAARIRAFFVDPAHARRGIGRALLERCEDDARASGFSRLELVATLPGVRLYARFGYERGALFEYAMGDGVTLELVPMSKWIGNRS